MMRSFHVGGANKPGTHLVSRDPASTRPVAPGVARRRLVVHVKFHRPAVHREGRDVVGLYLDQRRTKETAPAAATDDPTSIPYHPHQTMTSGWVKPSIRPANDRGLVARERGLRFVGPVVDPDVMLTGGADRGVAAGDEQSRRACGGGDPGADRAVDGGGKRVRPRTCGSTAGSANVR
jgi:hypothetical protein